ncbi:MAG: TonB-dependent receptor [Hyphomonadaceae bacterium]|nr:TonB-dependent receptor [Hyphomonadaceae bacterium]
MKGRLLRGGAAGAARGWADRSGAASAWLLAAALSSVPTVALAQTAESSAEEATVEDIVVTARRFEERLQSTPVAVSAFTSDALEQSGANTLTDVASVVPNLTMSNTGSGSGGASNPQIYMRGIGQVDFLITTDPGVAIYIDGVYYARSTGSAFDVLDLERLEVLRGPQGTLFGKNTIGGAINLISRRPSDEFGGQIQFTTGEFGRADVRASADLPLADDLRARVSGVWQNRDGFTDRVLVGDEMDDQDQVGGRAHVEWTPTNDLTLTFIADGTRARQGSTNTALLSFDPAAGLAPLWVNLVATPGALALPTVNSSTPFRNTGTGPNVSNLDLWGASLTTSWDMGAELTLRSITAFRELGAEFGRDGDNSSSQYVETHNMVDQRQFSQELQLLGGGPDSRLRWVLGAYYFDEWARDTNDVRLASGLWAALEGLPGAVIPLSPAVCPTLCLGGVGNPLNALFDLDFDIYNRVDTLSYAVFGQGSYDLTDRLSLTAGLRYTQEEKTYFLHHQRVNAGVPIIPPTTVSADFDDLSPRLGVEYQANDGLFLYAVASRGFKSGGFNGRPTTTAEVQSFGPESLWSYEAGLKFDSSDRRLRLNLATFFNQYDDIQISSVGADTTGNLILITENAGQAEAAGVEAELTAIPVDGLNLSASLGYIQAEYTELNPGATVTLDTHFMKTPEWTASAAASYTFPLSGNMGDLTVRGDWSYRSRVYNDPQNTPILSQGALSLFNGRIAWTDANERIELALFGTNLTDERYIVAGISAADSFGTVEGNFGRPREWGLSLRYTY